MGLPKFLQELNPEIYLEDSYVCYDYETTNRDKGSALNPANRILLSTWLAKGLSKSASGAKSVSSYDRVYNNIHYNWGDEYHQEELADAIRAARFTVAHHHKFDLQWSQRSGLEIGTWPIWCTLIGEFVLAGNRRWDLSLEGTGKRYGLEPKESLVKSLIEAGVCPSNVPEQWLIEYGVQDTNLCHQIFLKQRERIVNEGLLPVMFTRCLLTPVLADIEMNGVQLDAKRVKEEYEQASASLLSRERNLAEYAGGINWRSGPQVAELLYSNLKFKELRKGTGEDRTPTGRPRTDSDAIERLRADSGEQKRFKEAFIEYKKLSKKVENLEKLKACVEHDNGKLYAQFNQAVAGTHRLTSSGLHHKVQSQNIDNTLKSLFCASKSGWNVGEADGIQLEFRVAAHLGNDPIALSDIRNPTFDIHWQTAEAMHEKSRKKLTKEQRRDAKQFTFRPLYGGAAGDKIVRKYIKFFQERYKGIYETQTQWTYEVLKNKKLVTATGLTFYWPDTVLEESANGRGYIRNKTAIFNYPVQSLATADIIPIAVVFLWHRLKAMDLETFIVNTVHDSVIAEVAPGDEDTFTHLANRCFTVDCCDYLRRVYHIDFISPLGVSCKMAGHWSEGEEIKYEYDPISAKAA